MVYWNMQCGEKTRRRNFDLTRPALRTISIVKQRSSARTASTNHLFSMLSVHTKRVRISLKNRHIKSLCFHTHAHTFPGSPVESAFYELGTGGVVGIEQNEAGNYHDRTRHDDSALALASRRGIWRIQSGVI
jgi:hypothetical protein